MREPHLELWKTLIARRLASLDRTLAAEAIEELASHCADLYAEACDAGASDAAARDAVVRLLERTAFDDLAVRRRARRFLASRLDERTSNVLTRWTTDIAFDLRYALRGMRRHVGFTAALVSILAFGIGATIAAFTVIDAVMLRALPYPRPDALVVLSKVTNAGESRTVSTADWRDYAAQNASSLTLAAYSSWPMNLTGGGEPLRLRSFIVSGNFFEVAGEKPLLGRVFGAADDTPSAPGVAVLSEPFWASRFGRSPAVLGTSMLVNGRPVTIAGVMPRAFALPARDVDLWTAMGLAPEVLADRASEWVSVIGRLRPGVSLATAQANLSVTAASLSAQFPRTNRDERIAVHPLIDTIIGEVRRPLWLGAAAVVFVLLAACANAANLLLARATMRRDEIALCAALGADASRLARQLLVESAALAGIGGAAGIGAAWMFLRVFVTLGAGRVPRVETAQLNAAAIVVSVVVSMLTALLFGGGAAWLLARAKVSQAGRAQQSVTSPRLGGWLLASQMAFALVLAASALLVARAYAATGRIDPGFDVSDTVTLQMTLPRNRYPDSAAHARFAERIADQIASLPGVASVGIVSDLPFVGNQLNFVVRVDRDAAESPSEVRLTVRPADAGYFRTLKIPLAAGRYFEATDRAGAAPVAMVNRAAADRLWRGAAIGRRLQVAGDVERRVVGVVGDIRHAGLHATEGPVVYVPYAQKPFDFVNWAGIVVRGPGLSPSTVKAAIARVDPNQPVHAVMAMDEYVARELAPYRFGSLVVGSLAVAAFVLAIAGIYGLTAFIVGVRFRELGVRLALGAAPSTVVLLVLRQILSILVAGSAAGIIGTNATTRFVRAAMPASPGTGADPMVLAAAVTLLGVTSLLAALGPALRAARIDPKVALQT